MYYLIFCDTDYFQHVFMQKLQGLSNKPFIWIKNFNGVVN